MERHAAYPDHFQWKISLYGTFFQAILTLGHVRKDLRGAHGCSCVQMT